ncbi:2-C-methyl-D-erythritol 4-phosphatecytidylyltransferase [Striga asiatica]|uniref:2-C-methyl-D-erythritol 4-phosphatecytidylyltransferase n=1 Tax=Striga asiatica TaxID=4170 RepID=A0A5A7R9I8_STRAF|nr:2-C-methyl-D-erythritol 4-phosphatecytidylyltransferase [Striga asiatica]
MIAIAMFLAESLSSPSSSTSPSSSNASNKSSLFFPIPDSLSRILSSTIPEANTINLPKYLAVFLLIPCGSIHFKKGKKSATLGFPNHSKNIKKLSKKSLSPSSFFPITSPDSTIFPTVLKADTKRNRSSRTSPDDPFSLHFATSRLIHSIISSTPFCLMAPMATDPRLYPKAVSESGAFRSANWRSRFLKSSAAASDDCTTTVLTEPSLR